MAICEKCGKKYSFWSSEYGGKTSRILCDDCYLKFERADLKTILGEMCPDKKFKIIGVAYWNNMGTLIGTAFAKFIFGGIFGIFGMAASGKEHRAGVIAVSEDELCVIDFGLIVGEDLNLPELKKIMSKPKIIFSPLSSITSELVENKLNLKGQNINLKAVFPKSYSDDNYNKAKALFELISKK